MSTVSSGIGQSNHVVPQDTHFNYKASFISRGYNYLLSSSLNSPKYIIRPIEDHGSIEESIKKSNLDLFERTPTNESLFILAAKKVAIFASYLFINLIVGPIGVVYHASQILKNGAVWIFQKESKKEEMCTHFRSMIYDALHCALPVFCATMSIPLGLVTSISSGLFMAFAKGVVTDELFDLELATSDTLPEQERYGFHKSLLCRDLFGIVNQKTGQLLNWNSEIDKDITVKGTSSGTRTPIVGLKGYFIGLYQQEAIKLLESVREIQSKLPDERKIPFEYPPKAEKIIAFLERSSQLKESEKKEWEQKLQTPEENMNCIWEILSRSYENSTKKSFCKRLDSDPSTWGFHIIEEFPFTEEFCKPYFQVDC